MEISISCSCLSRDQRKDLEKKIIALIPHSKPESDSNELELDVTWNLDKEINYRDKVYDDIHRQLHELGIKEKVCFVIEYSSDDQNYKSDFFFFGHKYIEEEANYILEELKSLCPRIVRLSKPLGDKLRIYPDDLKKLADKIVKAENFIKEK